jgi:hypothetical protein
LAQILDSARRQYALKRLCVTIFCKLQATPSTSRSSGQVHESRVDVPSDSCTPLSGGAAAAERQGNDPGLAAGQTVKRSTTSRARLCEPIVVLDHIRPTPPPRPAVIPTPTLLSRGMSKEPVFVSAGSSAHTDPVPGTCNEFLSECCCCLGCYVWL